MSTVSLPFPTTTTIPIRTRVREAAISVADRVHRDADIEAQLDGLTVARVGLTRRSYRSHRFDEIGGAR